ncbi:uncharacterized protein LOC135827650 [Sycon ciliatum]|uniref:uncharacterized protein LOC135827650 n=1 Tax=Sycon ciliatum TaxID=27933 RepID=UPI0031F63350
MANPRYSRSGPASSLMSNQVDLGWDAVQRELKEIDHGQAALESSEFERGNRFAAINKKHWKAQETCTCCTNSACKKKFGALDRKLHCRRCGDVFCDACTQYKRKLSLYAKPDPDGQLYRVCLKCFDQGPQPLGTSRDWTAVFMEQRQRSRQLKSNGGPGYLAPKHSSLTRRLGVKEELDRLQHGFQNYAASWLKSTVAELRVSVPDWQRSPHWENPKTVTLCHICRNNFGILATKHHCKVCGRIMCKQCSAEELMLYMDDATKEVQWAIYGFEGCPAKEPSARLYLRCCSVCRDDLKPFKAKQLDAVEVACEADVMGDLAKIHTDLCHLQEKLEKQIPVFQEHVESMNGVRTTAGVSPIKRLAKSQMDVSDCITRYALLLNQRLRRVRPTHKLHATILSRIAQSKMLYYRERLFVFRALKHCLAESTPQEVLDLVQNTVELQTITSVYIFMCQLSMEVLNMTEVYSLDKELLESLMPLQRNETCTKDMKHAVDRCCKIGQPEDLEDHLRKARELISMRYKEKDQRLIKSHLWSANLTKSRRQALITGRCYEVVGRVHQELEAKSSVHHFEQSKEALSILKAQLDVYVSRQANGFVWR